MRNLAICTLIFMMSAIWISCTKEIVNKTASDSSLIGSTWTVVNDASSVAAGTSKPATYTNYIGKGGDFFNFTSYGKLYWSINGQRDTATYRISGDTIALKFPYINAQSNAVDSAYSPIYIISNLTAHTCTLFNSQVIFNVAGGGSPMLTTINLKK